MVCGARLCKSLFLWKSIIHAVCLQVKMFISCLALPQSLNLSPPLLSSADQPGHAAPCWPPATGARPAQQESHSGSMAYQRGQYTTEIQTGETDTVVCRLHLKKYYVTKAFSKTILKHWVVFVCRTWQRSTRKHCSCWGSSRRSFWTMSWSSGREGNSWQATGAHRREAWTSSSPGELFLHLPPRSQLLDAHAKLRVTDLQASNGQPLGLFLHFIDSL